MSFEVGRQTYLLPPALEGELHATLDEWRQNNKLQRLWAADATLWTGGDEDQWLGWLTVVQEQLAQCEELRQFAHEVQHAQVRDVVLLGMGGSSLCPEVFALTFGKHPGFPRLHILDSTDPAQILATERKIDLAHSWFIVASKSGSTLEPNILKQYFFERVAAEVGPQEVGKRFVVITDPGSKLQQVAESDGFRRIFFGVPSIAGRYSALSTFGVVPATVMGVDIERLLRRANVMVQACGAETTPSGNPGVVLGAILGVAAQHGRDKVTLIMSPGLGGLGAWLEQLVAESTGKQGKGLLPIALEPFGAASVYGADRVFVYVRLITAPDATQDTVVEVLTRAGQLVVRIDVADPYDLGQEFFRWQIATAVAGAILRVHPFDQPDVEASKIETRNMTSAYEERGTLPPETPFFKGDGLSLFADEGNATALLEMLGTQPSLPQLLATHFGRLRAGDYCALLAYLEVTRTYWQKLQVMRQFVRDRKRVATCLGFGPRFLHSTGQAYKGGPNNGVFLQVTCDDATDVPVPGQRSTFGVVKAAQARGDFQVLVERGRRVLRVHLGKNVEAGLTTLSAAIARALQ